jgi:hypothetical protein
MTDREQQLLADKRDAKTLTLAEAREQLAVYCKYKIWAGKYFALNTRVQELACAAWVHEDVFGNTF